MPAGVGGPSGADPKALYARAAEQARLGRLDDAARTLADLLRQAPGHADAWNLGGIVSHRRGDLRAAVAHFERAIAAGAGAGVHANLGYAWEKLGDVAAAERAYTLATTRAPTLGFAWQKLASLQLATGRPELALASWRRAIALDPQDLKSHGDALFLRRDAADWDESAPPTPSTLLAALATATRSDVAPALLLAFDEATPAQRRAAAALFARTQWGPLLAAPPLAASARADGGRLRIGYLSADFREHAVAYLATETIAAHDRDAVEVFVYAYRAPAPGDRWRAAAIAAADHFVDLDPLDDAAAAARIHADGVDVLVDLTGFTAHARPGIVARRPAPVIAQWLGYIGSVGEPRLADYVIGDAIATPPALAADFSETLALLPRCFQPNGALAPIDPPPARAEVGLPADGVVYCSFNQTYKLGPRLWDDWCAILRGVPGSVLWLVAPKLSAGTRNLRAEAERRGVAGERLVFAPMVPRRQHLARLALADLALDTHPYNSGTTASDALRVGVPLLTFAGPSFVSRMAASLLHAAGLADGVLPDRDAMVARAIALGRDAAARAALRARVPAAVRASGVFDPPAFARDLERLFAEMIAQRRAGRREAIVLAPKRS